MKIFAITLVSIIFLQSLCLGASKKNDIIFDKKYIYLAGKLIHAEIADTPEKSERGLMFRTKIGPNSGMLFIFDDERPRSFWMKNTFIPLDIGYFNSKKELIDVQTMTPVTSEMQLDIPTYPSKGPAMYALELPKGWFSKHKIRLKERFSFK